jgi:Raf kinase inhibitor-like YbhB/YbcL family protein
MSLNITSRVFEDGGGIPGKYTCDTDNISPPLAWSNVPGAAKELALILDDPDAPSGVFVHWVVYGLPATAVELEQAAPPTGKLRAGGAQGRNRFGNIGYGGTVSPKRRTPLFSPPLCSRCRYRPRAGGKPARSGRGNERACAGRS